jgi:superfamily II DNA or RNA helicase
MLPARFRSAFSPATLNTIETRGAKLRVAQPLFFRSAYTAAVTENERRSFHPIVVLDPARAPSGRCTCVEAMKPNDLCRHIAALIVRSAGDDGALAGERFESSLWRAVGFAAFSEGHVVDAGGDGDPREQLLRKYVLTDQEQALLARGSGSTRLQWEASPWYRWAKSMFLRDPNGDRATLELRDGRFHLMDVPLPTAAVEHVLPIAARSGFEVAPQSLEATLMIELTPERALKLTPVLLAGSTIHRRARLPQYGRFFLIGRRFASPRAAEGMFAEKAKNAQASLFEARSHAGLPLDRETVIPESEVFAFIERHREELAAMRPELAPECVRNAQPLRLDGEAVFDFAPPHGNLLDVDVVFDCGTDTPVCAADIVSARAQGIRALNRGNLWIDVTDPQFDCLPSAASPRLLLTKLELMRIRGSLRGRAVFRGDESCRRVFAMFDDVQTGAGAPRVELGLYPYQQTGYEWLWLLQQNGFGGLLCDDMGLGKTHQAMALIRAVTSADPHASVLVVCPTSVLDHWRDKLARYVPAIDVTLTSYGIVRNRIEQFRARHFDLLVLDEAQTIKNADTTTHQALLAIDKGVAVGLTGTPIENHERELKALLDFVVPGYLPRAAEDDRALLARLARPFVLRRTKAQVLTELPPKIVDKRTCELLPEQRALYRHVMQSRAKPLRMQLRAGVSVSYVHVFAALNYLKQICNHPESAGGGFATPAASGKWELFVELLDECMASGLKVVVFSQYVKMLELIERHLAARAIGFASIKGHTRARGAEIARFRDDAACRVFTASLRAGGLGIDLTSASVVIHYDRWWNQAREDQATDRVHRLGQSKGVQVIKLITRGTVEEKIDELIARKAQLANDIVRPDDPALVKQFSVEELDELLSE